MENQYPLIQFAKLIFTQGQASLQVKEKIQAFPSASYSCALSTVAFICYHFPHLSPPGIAKIEKNEEDDSFPAKHLSYNKNYEPWCEYIGGLIRNDGKGFFYQFENVLAIVVNVDQDFYKVLKSKNELFNEHQSKCECWKDLSQILGKEFEPVEKKKKIGIMNLATYQLRNDPHRPRIEMTSLLTGIWYQQRDIWKCYNILRGNVPTEEDFADLDVVIITGSGLSVNDDNPNVQKMLAILKECLKKDEKLKVLGLCFGHQSLTKMYGGKVEKLPRYAGIEKIKFDKSIVSKLPYFQNVVKSDSNYFISEFHGDYVVQIPQNFQNIGTSQSTTYESIVSKDGRCLGFQFHAEYTTQYTRGYEMRVKHYELDDHLGDFSGPPRPEYATPEALEHHKKSLMELRKVGRQFFDWKN